MRCIRCNKDNKLKDRTATGGRCSNCYHPFVFEPTRMMDVKFTDLFFAKAIADISVNSTLFFTPKQFLYFLDRRLKNKIFSTIKVYIYSYIFFMIITLILDSFFIHLSQIIGLTITLILNSFFISLFEIQDFLLMLIVYNLFWIFGLLNSVKSSKSSPETRRNSATALQLLGIFITFSGVFYGVITNSPIIYATTAFVGLSAFWVGFFERKRLENISQAFLINANQMLGWLYSWTIVNGSVTKLLSSVPNALPALKILPDPNVTNYSFDRLVVCQTDDIAKMLIANNFHFENNCAILSISGYPQSIFETTMQMLRRNPELRVFAFHDCSPEGIKLAQELRTNPRWFPDETIVIVDIGLSPRQILAAKRDMFIESSKNSAQASRSLPSSLRENLSQVELEWLDRGNFVELESFTPQQLIQVLNRSIANSQQGELSRDTTLILVEGTDSYFRIYTTESFG